MLNYKPYSERSDCKYKGIFGIWAEGVERSNIPGTIALVRCILRIEEQLYNE